MDILKNLTNLLGGASAPSQYPQSSYAGQAGQPGAAGAGGLESVLNPGTLGNLARVLFPSGNANMSPASGALGAGLGGLGGILTSLMSSGALAGLFNNKESNAAPAIPGYTTRPASVPVQSAQTEQDRTVRLLRALVFAAKSDGHIDQNEQQALNAQVQNMDLDQQVKTLLEQFMTEPLDPSLVAKGVTDQQEAAQIYGLSCALTEMDSFMERSYLDGLATALGLPAQTKSAIENQVRSGR